MPMGAAAGMYGEGMGAGLGSEEDEDEATGAREDELVDAAEDVFGRLATSMRMEEEGDGEGKEAEDGLGTGLGDEDDDEDEDEGVQSGRAGSNGVVHDPFGASNGSGSASGSSTRDRFGDSIKGKQVLDSSMVSAMSASAGVSSGGRDGGIMQQMVQHARRIGGVAESVSGAGFDS